MNIRCNEYFCFTSFKCFLPPSNMNIWLSYLNWNQIRPYNYKHANELLLRTLNITDLTRNPTITSPKRNPGFDIVVIN